MKYIYLSYRLKAQKISDVTGPREQNPGTFLSQYSKSQMRHYSVAHATVMCRTIILKISIRLIMKGNGEKIKVLQKEKFGIFGRNPEKANIFVKTNF